MTITIPNGRTIELKTKAGGGFESVGLGGGGAGGLEHGQRLTITGSGFGAVADPSPSTLDIFDYQLSDGDLIPDGAGTKWGENGGTFADQFELDGSVVLPGRTFSAKSRAPKSILQDPVVTGQPLSARSFYSQHWQRFNESLDSPPQPETNRADKIIRMTDGSSDCGTRVSWEANVWRCYITHPTDYDLCRSGSSSNYVWDQYLSGTPWNTANTWVRVETVWTDNGDDSCDVSLRVNGREAHKFLNVFHPPAYVNSDWRQELVGHDISQTNKVTTTLRTWLADHVTQGTVARVEFSNNATYDPAVTQKRYYQVCESRSDTQIVIDSAMMGDLDLESAVYMHAINDNETATTVELVVGQNVAVG